MSLIITACSVVFITRFFILVDDYNKIIFTGLVKLKDVLFYKCFHEIINKVIIYICMNNGELDQ